MKNFKLVKTTAALALGASVVTAAVVPGATTASAASKYKVSNGQLVNAKTGKVVKGYVVFKSKLYYNGKLKKGYKTVGSGKTIKLYYNGKLKEGYKTARNNKLLFFNGSLKKGYKTAGNGERLYKDGHLDKGYEVYGDVDKDPSLYYNGYLKSGYKTANNATLLFYNGKLKSGYKTAKEGTVLYKEGRLNEGLALVGGKLFKDSSLNKGLEKYEDKFYFDADLANGTYEYEGKEIAVENGVEVGAKVNSVEAINGTTVKVTFNKAVDKTEAEKAGVVVIEGVTTLSKGELSEDGKTLTLTSTEAIKVTDAAVVVNPIKTKADDKVSTEKYVSKMTYEDKVAPSIVSVEAKTNGTVAKTATIQLSEPVKAGALVKVDGDYATVKSFTGTTSDTLELTGLNLEAGKSHTVELINAEDVAGNKVVSTTATFTVSVDAAIPVATVSAGSSDKEILVTFNKSMDESTVKNITVKDETLANVNVGAIKAVENTNSTQFSLTVSDSIFANKDSRTFNVVLPKDMEDKLGNKTTESVQKVTLTKDAAKPVATGYNVLKDKDGKVEAIEINFSEGLSAGSVTTGSSLHDVASSIVDANGVLDTTTFANFTSQAVKAGDKKVVFKTLTPVAITGQYAISFKNELVTDLSEAGNKSAAFNYTIDFGKGSQATEFELDSKNATSASNNVITVKFPEAVKGGAVAGSATDVANYTLAGKPLPTGTTITLNKAQDTATITLPAESIVKNDQAAVFTVANVKNTAGTKTLKTYTGTVEVKDNVAPKLQSAQLLADGKTFVLTYDENLSSDLTGDVASAFKFTEDGKEVTVSGAVIKSVAGKTLIVEAQKSAGTEAVKAPADGFYDATGKAYLVKSGDAIGENKFYNTGEVIVNADPDNSIEEVKAPAAGFYDATGKLYTVKSGDAIGENKFFAKDAVIVPAVSATYFDTTKTVTIETVAAKDKVEDATGNDQKAEVKVTTTR